MGNELSKIAVELSEALKLKYNVEKANWRAYESTFYIKINNNTEDLSDLLSIAEYDVNGDSITIYSITDMQYLKSKIIKDAKKIALEKINSFKNELYNLLDKHNVKLGVSDDCNGVVAKLGSSNYCSDIRNDIDDCLLIYV